MGQRAGPAVPDDAAVVDDLLKFRRGFVAFPCRQVGLAANIHGIQTGNIVDELDLSEVDARRSFEAIDGSRGILSVQLQLRLNRRQPERLYLGIEKEAMVQISCQRFCDARSRLPWRTPARPPVVRFDCPGPA